MGNEKMRVSYKHFKKTLRFIANKENMYSRDASPWWWTWSDLRLLAHDSENPSFPKPQHPLLRSWPLRSVPSWFLLQQIPPASTVNRVMTATAHGVTIGAEKERFLYQLVSLIPIKWDRKFYKSIFNASIMLYNALFKIY